LLEVLMVIAIIGVLCAISLPQIGVAVKSAKMESAFQTLVGAMREARQTAVDNRQIVRLTFVAPRTVLIERRDPLPPNNGAATYSLVRSVDLPIDVQFSALPGIPVGTANGPDGLGSGLAAVDFNNGGTQLYFQPDGTAEDTIGKVANGVVYIARTPDVNSSRAVTMLGATGRLKGWRLVKSGAAYAWHS
jgi:Tfp pilus assembly protein FimT